MATRIDITMDQGSSFEFSVDVQDVSGVPMETLEANYAISAMMRRHYTSTNSYSFTTEANTSQAIITMTPTQTAAIPAGRYVYDVEIRETTSNAITRIIEGVVTVTPEVTR